MKAFIVERADGPFREIEMAVPVPAPGQVLVKIHASGINPLDTKIRAGSAAHARQPLLAVLGIDMAGIVEEVGPEVTEFRAGDEVFGMVGGVGGLFRPPSAPINVEVLANGQYHFACSSTASVRSMQPDNGGKSPVTVAQTVSTLTLSY